MKHLAVILFLLLPVVSAFPEMGNPDAPETGNSLLYEKVYLHTDRELYSPGDDIWVKSYLVSGINHRLIEGYKNIYVQLVADDGTIADQILLLSWDGTAKGDFQLSGNMPEGTYTIRAYTKYLKNFGEESFFHKKIIVAGARNSLELEEKEMETKSGKIDVAFLPESGSFVLNAVNHIAFKAIDEEGKGIAVTGKVIDETGNETVSFSSSYKGMGKFIMMPQEGKEYFAVIDGFPDFRHKFEKPGENGVCLNYRPDGNYLVFTLTRNLKLNHAGEYLLVAAHKGTELFSTKITMNEFQQALRLFKGLFPLGISMVTLYEPSGEKVAERLVFVRNSDDRKMRIIAGREEYKTREKVTLRLQSLLSGNDTLLPAVSVAVVNEDYLSAGGNNQNIESYLLLDSELKGSIESPASFFVDEPEITADEKLDFIMMVNGWRSYYWNELDRYAGTALPGWADYGLNIGGNVTRSWGGKPADNARITLGPFSRNFLFEKDTADESGNFNFDKLYLKDSALIMITAETKNRSRKTDIHLSQSLSFDTLVPAAAIDAVSRDIRVPMKFYRDIYHRKIAMQEWEKELGSILLREVEVEGKQGPQLEGHFRLYGEPDHSFTITSDDWTFTGIAEYLETKVPGVVVTGDEIRIRAGYGNPLLLVDGLEVSWDYIKYLPLGDVDKIEILKNSALMVVFGSRGGNGVISVLTKMGRGDLYNEFVRNIPGRITPRVKGFQQPRQFYSPKYTSGNINDPRPDHRPTLYWNPEVIFSGGKASLEFFTSDKIARYHIFVEGISKNGKIINSTGIVTVSTPRQLIQ